MKIININQKQQYNPNFQAKMDCEEVIPIVEKGLYYAYEKCSPAAKIEHFGEEPFNATNSRKLLEDTFIEVTKGLKGTLKFTPDPNYPIKGEYLRASFIDKNGIVHNITSSISPFAHLQPEKRDNGKHFTSVVTELVGKISNALIRDSKENDKINEFTILYHKLIKPPKQSLMEFLTTM